MVTWTYARAAKCLEAVIAEAERGDGDDLPTLRKKTEALRPVFLKIGQTNYQRELAHGAISATKRYLTQHRLNVLAHRVSWLTAIRKFRDADNWGPDAPWRTRK
jgi:hypothetical protein